MASKMRIGILGAKAYTARELVGIFLRHPHAEVTVLQAREEQPVPFEEFYGQFRDRGLPPITPVDLDHLEEKCDVVFLALPHKASQEYTPKLLEKNLRVLDLSADFRFRDVALYEETYKIQHVAPDLCAEAVYGLPELYRAQLPGARLVACPGCYVTATILALAPLVKAGVVDPDSLIADAKSGVSGAGRTPSDTTHFCEANEAMKPYGVAVHRHAPEIEDHLSRLAGEPRQVTFVPHLAPMDRGIVSTCYANLKRAMSLDGVRKLYADFYFDEPFVRLLPPGQYPSTKNVAFSNDCDLGIQVEERSGRVIVMSAIDNLVKGASGQAVQCLNIVCGWEETAGLR